MICGSYWTRRPGLLATHPRNVILMKVVGGTVYLTSLISGEDFAVTRRFFANYYQRAR